MVGLVLLSLVGSATCAQQSNDSGTLALLTVDDPFTMQPPATSINVDALQTDGGVVALQHGIPVADATINLGLYSEAIEEAIEVTGFDADGGVVAWGETLPVTLSELAGATLDVFVQRTGMLSRLPSATIVARASPYVGMLSQRYVFIAGGTDPVDGSAAVGTTMDLYDLYEFTAASNPPTFSSPPQSFALYDLTLLAIWSSGASWLDMESDGGSGTATMPAGNATWADVAGGGTVYSSDGIGYVVGATRPSGQTAAILVVGTDGALSIASLNTPRAGATAVWVAGTGLLVLGGDAGGAGDAGTAELLGPGATLAQPLDLGVSFSSGAAAALDGSHVVLVGGDVDDGGASDTIRIIDLSCSQSCSASPWSAPLSVALVEAQAFALTPTSVFVLGDDATGATHAFLLSASSVTEEPLRIPRRHARGVRLPTGQIAVIGWQPQMESFLAAP
jgi:hypothetical protein